MWDLLSVVPNWFFLSSLLTSNFVLWIVGSLFAIGIVGLVATFFMRFIPFVYVYRSPIQILSILLLLLSTFSAGWVLNERLWNAKVEEFQIKVAKAEKESTELNNKLAETTKQTQKVIKERGETIIQYVEKEVVKYNDKCEIPKEFNQAHNKAAEQPK